MSATPTLSYPAVESSLQRKYITKAAQTFPCGFRAAKVRIIFYMYKGKVYFCLNYLGSEN